MIRLSGPTFVEPGSTVCITATGVGAGFSAKAVTADSSVKLKVTIDLTKHTATICFVAPSSGAGVSVFASNTGSSTETSHTTISL